MRENRKRLPIVSPSSTILNLATSVTSCVFGAIHRRISHVYRPVFGRTNIFPSFATAPDPLLNAILANDRSVQRIRASEAEQKLHGRPAPTCGFSYLAAQ